MRRCDELGRVSDEPGRLTRTFHSPAMQRANRLVGSWMRAAGMAVREDAAFNLLGVWRSRQPRARTLLLGSHLDTVPNAGKYDGPLGVLTAIAAVELVREQTIALPFHVEIAGFSDEEGVRYQTAYLGSGAFAGALQRKVLARIEEKGIEKARRSKKEFIGYCEVHIEQGPVLEANHHALGVVSAIAGQSRIAVEFEGQAGHAGTVPMSLRRDALTAAAELVLAVERCGVTATVGQLRVEPGASNVIPGKVILTLDVRDQSDVRRRKAVATLQGQARKIASRRGLRLRWQCVQESSTVQCDRQLTQTLARCVQDSHRPMTSGAGHDAVMISRLCPVTMLFVRCKGGISHHPDESVRESDARAAVQALADFIILLGKRHAAV
jgi:allantoate deiminase